MKQKVKKAVKTSFTGITPFVAMMSACMLVGIAVGCVCAAHAEGTVLSGLIGEDLLAFSSDGTWQYSFSKTFFNLIKYPTAVFLLSFTAFGVVVIPALMFLKGFVLSLSVSSVLSSLGKRGIITAFSVFGVQSAVSIPCLILLAALAFEISKVFACVLVPQKRRLNGKKPSFIYFLVFFVFCCILLFLTASLDSVLTPKLLSLSLRTIL